MPVPTTRNAYYFTRAMLKTIIKMNKMGLPCRNVLCPIPCIGVGQMNPKTAGFQINMAFEAIVDNDGLIYKIYADNYEELKNYPEIQIDSISQNSKAVYLWSIM